MSVDPRLNLMGLEILCVSADRALDRLLQSYSAGERTRLAFANSNLLYHSQRQGMAEKLSSEFVIVNDGVALDALAMIALGERFKENLNGTDFTPRLLAKLPEGARVFLYGSREDVVRTAAERLKPMVTVCGYANGYDARPSEAAALARSLAADVVLVALGNPAQEKWILDYGDAAGARLLVGVGAFFDFLSGDVRRAPTPIRRLRLEWLFRLALEPRRLAKRYTLDIGTLVLLALGSRFGAKGAVHGS